MKKLGLALLLLFTSILTVNAASGNYYYPIENGKYHLCTDENCVEVYAGQPGFKWDLNNGQIISGDLIYKYDEKSEEDYKNNKIKKYFFYRDDNDNYVLCKTEKICITYSFEELARMGAIIESDSKISFGDSSIPEAIGRETYYYKGLNSENNNKIPEPTTDYCTKLKEPLKFIGQIVLIIKILIPVLIIAFGMLDFFRAIIGSKDDEIKKSMKSLVMRVLSGVIIFFIPTIVSAIFSLISDFGVIRGDFDACQKCIFRVSKCK